MSKASKHNLKDGLECDMDQKKCETSKKYKKEDIISLAKKCNVETTGTRAEICARIAQSVLSGSFPVTTPGSPVKPKKCSLNKNKSPAELMKYSKDDLLKMCAERKMLCAKSWTKMQIATSLSACVPSNVEPVCLIGETLLSTPELESKPKKVLQKMCDEKDIKYAESWNRNKLAKALRACECRKPADTASVDSDASDPSDADPSDADPSDADADADPSDADADADPSDADSLCYGGKTYEQLKEMKNPELSALFGKGKGQLDIKGRPTKKEEMIGYLCASKQNDRCKAPNWECKDDLVCDASNQPEDGVCISPELADKRGFEQITLSNGKRIIGNPTAIKKLKESFKTQPVARPGSPRVPSPQKADSLCYGGKTYEQLKEMTNPKLSALFGKGKGQLDIKGRPTKKEEMIGYLCASKQNDRCKAPNWECKDDLVCDASNQPEDGVCISPELADKRTEFEQITLSNGKRIIGNPSAIKKLRETFKTQPVARSPDPRLPSPQKAKYTHCHGDYTYEELNTMSVEQILKQFFGPGKIEFKDGLDTKEKIIDYLCTIDPDPRLPSPHCYGEYTYEKLNTMTVPQIIEEFFGKGKLELKGRPKTKDELIAYICSIGNDRKCKEPDWSCEDGYICDASNDPGICIPKKFGEDKYLNNRKFDSMMFNGKKIIGTKTSIANLRKKLENVEPILPPREPSDPREPAPPREPSDPREPAPPREPTNFPENLYTFRLMLVAYNNDNGTKIPNEDLLKYISPIIPKIVAKTLTLEDTKKLLYDPRISRGAIFNEVYLNWLKSELFCQAPEWCKDGLSCNISDEYPGRGTCILDSSIDRKKLVETTLNGKKIVGSATAIKAFKKQFGTYIELPESFVVMIKKYIEDTGPEYLNFQDYLDFLDQVTDKIVNKTLDIFDLEKIVYDKVMPNNEIYNKIYRRWVESEENKPEDVPRRSSVRASSDRAGSPFRQAPPEDVPRGSSVRASPYRVGSFRQTPPEDVPRGSPVSASRDRAGSPFRQAPPEDVPRVPSVRASSDRAGSPFRQAPPEDVPRGSSVRASPYRVGSFRQTPPEDIPRGSSVRASSDRAGSFRQTPPEDIPRVSSVRASPDRVGSSQSRMYDRVNETPLPGILSGTPNRAPPITPPIIYHEDRTPDATPSSPVFKIPAPRSPRQPPQVPSVKASPRQRTPSSDFQTPDKVPSVKASPRQRTASSASDYHTPDKVPLVKVPPPFMTPSTPDEPFPNTPPVSLEEESDSDVDEDVDRRLSRLTSQNQVPITKFTELQDSVLKCLMDI